MARKRTVLMAARAKSSRANKMLHAFTITGGPMKGKGGYGHKSKYRGKRRK